MTVLREESELFASISPRFIFVLKMNTKLSPVIKCTYGCGMYGNLSILEEHSDTNIHQCSYIPVAVPVTLQIVKDPDYFIISSLF